MSGDLQSAVCQIQIQSLDQLRQIMNLNKKRKNQIKRSLLPNHPLGAQSQEEVCEGDICKSSFLS